MSVMMVGGWVWDVGVPVVDRFTYYVLQFFEEQLLRWLRMEYSKLCTLIFYRETIFIPPKTVEMPRVLLLVEICRCKVFTLLSCKPSRA